MPRCIGAPDAPQDVHGIENENAPRCGVGLFGTPVGAEDAEQLVE